MSDTITATVETLTAEVRVLMVGNRQVTMSVFKQLDWVEPDDLTPFGRVSPPRTRVDERPFEWIDLCGVDDHGNLVRAGMEPPEWITIGPAAFDHWCLHRQERFSNPCTIVNGATRNLQWRHYEDRGGACRAHAHRDGCSTPGYCYHSDDAVGRWLCAEYQHLRSVGDYCDMPALERAWRNKANDQMAELTADQNLYDGLSQLPLIVLAGLR